MVILLAYLDDIILTGPHTSKIAVIRNLPEQRFKLKVIGDLHYFLGLEIAKSTKGIHLSQRKYTLQLLQDTGFVSAKPAHVFMEMNLTPTNTDGPHASSYGRLIGRLMYLNISRLDIAFVVNRLSQYMQQPQAPHLGGVVQI